jgi:hypothetical protein
MAHTNTNSVDASCASLKSCSTGARLTRVHCGLLKAPAMDTHAEGAEAIGVGAGVVVDVPTHGCAAAAGFRVHLEDVALGGGEEGSGGGEDGCELHDGRVWWMLVVCWCFWLLVCCLLAGLIEDGKRCQSAGARDSLYRCQSCRCSVRRTHDVHIDFAKGSILYTLSAVSPPRFAFLLQQTNHSENFDQMPSMDGQEWINAVESRCFQLTVSILMGQKIFEHGPNCLLCITVPRNWMDVVC